MSSVYRVGVQIYGSAAGYIGTVNQTLRGTTKLSQGFRTATASSKLLDNQIKAIGTTARYALAGSLIFGITGALSRLGDFSAELGTIDSLAGKLNEQGKFEGLGNQLQDIGSEAIKMSDRFGTSVSDIEQYMARFYSTFQTDQLRNPTQQMEGFTRAVLDLQTALGTEAGDPGALAAGIGGLINVIPGGKSNPAAMANRIGNLVAYLTQVTPNITGTDIANAAGRFASIYNTAAITPEQLFAIYGQAAKAGGSPSITTRGVTQLLGQSLLRPQTPANKAAYTAAGLPTDPNALRNMGGFAVLEQLMRTVAPGGLNLSRRQLQAANNATSVNQLQTALPGLNVTELYNLFGRIQSVQQFVNILSQGGIKGLQDYLKGQREAERQNLLTARATQVLRESGLKILSNAMSNISLSLVRGLNAPLSTFSRVIQKVSDELAGHRTTTTALEGGVLGLGALRILGRTSVFGGAISRIPILGRVAGASRLGQRAAGAAIMAEESAAVAAGGAADGSRANPFWVIISPYSWQFGSGGMSQPVGTKTKATEDVLKTAAKVGGGAAISSGAAATLAAALGLPAIALGVPWALGHVPGAQVHRTYAQAMQKAASHNATGSGAYTTSTRLASQLGVFGAYGQNVPALAAALAAAHLGTKALHSVRFEGNAKADLTIRLVDKNGNQVTVVEKKGVPIAVTKDTPPTSQGRPGVRKGK